MGQIFAFFRRREFTASYQTDPGNTDWNLETGKLTDGEIEALAREWKPEKWNQLR